MIYLREINRKVLVQALARLGELALREGEKLEALIAETRP